jgi:hypothetical protein
MVVNAGWHPEPLPEVRQVHSVRQRVEICNINRPNPWRRFADTSQVGAIVCLFGDQLQVNGFDDGVPGLLDAVLVLGELRFQRFQSLPGLFLGALGLRHGVRRFFVHR